MEKRAENLLAKLESIREILDRITQSQTDKMVRDEAEGRRRSTQSCC